MKKKLLATTIAATVVTGFVDTSAFGAEVKLEEVLVTARRREENLQQVPLAVTALDPQKLAEQGISSNQDLKFAAPSLIPTNIAGGALVEAGYIIRGQGPGAGSSNVGGVVTYFAEVPTHLTSMPYYDVSSVQVLNGPQGTLFGRNTTGGAVLISPQAPTSKWEGYGRVQLGNYDYREFEGAVNMPLIPDKVMLRLAADLLERDGYLKEVNTGNDLLDRDGQFYRATLLVKPTDWLDNTLIYDSVNIDTNGGGMELAHVRTGSVADQTFGPGLAPFFGGQTLQGAYAQQQALGLDRTSIDTPTLEKRHIWTVVNTTNIDLGETALGKLSLKNIVSYRHNDVDQQRDFDGTALPIVNSFAFNDYSSYYTEEFQVRGLSMNDRLDWVVGYYTDRNDDADRDKNLTVQVLFGLPPLPFLPPQSWPLSIYGLADETSEAIFGQSSYALTDQLKLTLGIRYTEDERHVKTQQFAGPTAVCAVSNPEPGCVRHAKGDWDATTWTASLDYQWTPDLLVYFATRHGYKAGTFNTDIDPSSEFYLVDPETVTDFELGSKFDWSVGNVQNRTNIAAYYSEYQDIQRNVSTVVNGIISTLVRNAAEARIEGVELTHSSFFGESFEVNAMYAYTDAEFTKVDDPILQASSGGELSGVPKSKGSLTLRYHLPLDASFGSASIGVTGNYTTRWNWVDTIGIEPYGYSPEVTTVDARADWRNVMSSNLDIGLFIKNATDERYPIGGVAINATVGITNVIYSEPRMYGLDLRYKFGQ